MIINQENIGNLFTGYQANFNEGFRSPESYFEKIATVVVSTTKSETYAWLGQYPRLRKWLGERMVKNLAAHAYTITNEKFESTIAVPKDDIEDDTFGVFSPLFAEMGFAAKTHPDELIFALLAAGFETPCFDRQPFFDEDHSVAGASVSNMQDGANPAWFLMDCRRPLKPLIFQKRKEYALVDMVDAKTENVWRRDQYEYGVDTRVQVGFGFWQQAFASKAALTAENFDAAFKAMMKFKSDEGRPLGIKPSLLVVGPENRAAALKVTETINLANGASNHNYHAVETMVCEYLE